MANRFLSIFSLATALGVALSTLAAADDPNPHGMSHTAEVLKSLKKGAIARIYLDGLREGLAAANVKLTLNSQQPLFCAPSLTADQSGEILEKYLATHADMLGLPMSAALLFAFIDEFPCAAPTPPAQPAQPSPPETTPQQ